MAHARKQNITNLHKNVARPARRMLSPFEDFDSLFAQLRSNNWLDPFGYSTLASTNIPMFAEGRTPKVDIIDKEKDLLVRAELPGVDKKDLDISMTDNSVTIKAETKYENKEEEDNYYRSEISQGLFSRTVSLPADVDIDHAKSSFKDGVLELSIPKLERSQRRSIKID